MAFIAPTPLSLSSALSPIPLTKTHVSCTQPFPSRRISQLPSHIAPFASAANETDVTSSESQSSKNSSPLAPPPSTFYQAISQAQQAVNAAISDGYRLLEIEFPPLPTAQLESSAVSSYDVSDANVRLAVDFARKYASSGTRVAIAFPDLVEKDRAVEQNNDREEPVDNIRFSSVRDAKKGAFIERLWREPEVDVAVRDDDDMFVVLGVSCQELPDVERMVEKAGKRPVILFNLRLDTARGDLGLPAFPRRELHFRFLSRVLPVYYLRTRTYSRSIAKVPFVVNYSGALYRVYPGAYQVLLDTEQGNYQRLTALDERPPLGRVRDILTNGLNIDGVKGKRNSFLFKGFKARTWWEEDRVRAVSNNWRS